MTAFLYIPAHDDARQGRRVDFANIASLFGEAQAAPPQRRGRWLLQFVSALVLVIAAISDIVVVPHADPASPAPGMSRPAGPARATSL